jgi:hypothetical protein
MGREHVYSIDGPGIVGSLERILGQAKAIMAGCCPPAPADR